MNPLTHFFIGWCIASTDEQLDRRERAMISIAAVAPDADGLGAFVELATRNTSDPRFWYSDYHHVLAHNIGFAIALTLIAGILARRRAVVALLTLLSVHSHFVGDLLGSRGPDGYVWPIPYLLPFSDAGELRWNGAWMLNGWQNIAITIATLAVTFMLARRRGYSPLEMISRNADRAFVDALRARFARRESVR